MSTKEIKIPGALTEIQVRHFGSILWLLDDSGKNRATGRTIAMAYAFLSIALNNPGKVIGVFDHLGRNMRANGRMLDEIYLLVPAKLRKDFEFNRANMSLKYL